MNANKVIAAIISNFTDQHSPVTTPTFDVLDRFGKPGEIVVERANERTLKLATEQFQRGAGDFLNWWMHKPHSFRVSPRPSTPS
jgi:hypothetical protein